MLSLDATQQSIIDSDRIETSWLFEIEGASTHYVSTKAKTFDSQPYTFKVVPESFQGIKLTRLGAEAGMIRPNSLEFDLENEDGVLDPTDFEDNYVLISLVMDNGTDEEIICQWKYRTISCFEIYSILHFTCEDFLQEYLRSEWPNTDLVSEIAPADDLIPADDLCIAEIFGTAYIPLRSVWVDGDSQRFYVLGDSTPTYTVSNVRSPRNAGEKAEFSSANFTFNQYTKSIGGSNRRVLEPIIADTDDDDVADSIALWKSGEEYLDALVEFYKSDTSSLTGPEDVIEYILESMGVPSADLDTGGGSSFETAGTTFSGWSLTFEGGYFHKEQRSKILAELLNMCHSTLRITDKIELHVLSKTSQQTITSADVANAREGDTERFRYQDSGAGKDDIDSGYIAYQVDGDPQDVLCKILVTATGTYNHKSSETLTCPLLKSQSNSMKAGMLHYQRKHGKIGSMNFPGKPTLLALQPDDVITINDSKYGDSFTCLVDSMMIRKEGYIEFSCIKYGHSLDDWGDLSPSTKTINTDASTGTWNVVMAGPNTPGSYDKPNLLPGIVRIGETGDHILIDPSQKLIQSSDYVTGAMGSGFLLSPGLLETGNIAARGIIRGAVFEVDTKSAISGSLAVTKSNDVLAEAMTALDSCNLKIEGNVTFAVGDRLHAQAGGESEWMQVTSDIGGGEYDVDRDKGGSYGADSNPVWPKGTAIVNYGQSGDGGILATASETNAPYISIFTHAGSPWSTLTNLVRYGNLNGYAGYSSKIFGLASYIDANNYFKIEATNGLQMSGQIVITGGSGIGNLSDAGVLATADDLDDVPNGSTYGRARVAILDSGYLYLMRKNADATKYFQITASGFEGYVNSVKLLEAGGGFVKTGNQSGYYSYQSNSGLEILNAATSLAFFGATMRVGQEAANKGNFYVDSSGNTYWRVNTTAVITITNSMIPTIDITAGGDINMKNTVGNSATLNFVGNSRTYSFYASYNDDNLAIVPDITGYGNLLIGYEPDASTVRAFVGIQNRALDLFVATADNGINFASMGLIRNASYSLALNSTVFSGNDSRIGAYADSDEAYAYFLQTVPWHSGDSNSQLNIRIIDDEIADDDYVNLGPGPFMIWFQGYYDSTYRGGALYSCLEGGVILSVGNTVGYAYFTDSDNYLCCFWSSPNYYLKNRLGGTAHVQAVIFG